jgi:ribonuclease Z
VALGVPKGPLLGLLKAGNDITLEDGTVVKSKDVISDKKKGKIITILGDTKYCDASIELAKNADVVIHEATFDAHTTDLAAAYGHSTNVEAALVAQRANAKSLILTHISARFLTKDLEQLLQEAQAVFANTYLANDFSIFSVHQLAKNEM